MKILLWPHRGKRLHYVLFNSSGGPQKEFGRFGTEKYFATIRNRFERFLCSFPWSGAHSYGLKLYNASARSWSPTETIKTYWMEEKKEHLYIYSVLLSLVALLARPEYLALRKSVGKWMWLGLTPFCGSEGLYIRLLRHVRKEVSLKYENNNGHFTRSPTHIFDNISLNCS